MEKQRIFNSNNIKGVTYLMAALIALLSYAGSSYAASNPPANFISSYVVYSEDDSKGPFEVTVNDLLKHGLNADAKKEWQKMGDDKWILTVTMSDAFSGKTSVIKILFGELKSPTRAIVQRILVNGKETNELERYTVADQLLYAAQQGKN